MATPHQGGCAHDEGSLGCKHAEESSQVDDEWTNLNLSYIQRVHCTELRGDPNTRIRASMIATPNQLDCGDELTGSMLQWTEARTERCFPMLSDVFQLSEVVRNATTTPAWRDTLEKVASRGVTISLVVILTVFSILHNSQCAVLDSMTMSLTAVNFKTQPQVMNVILFCFFFFCFLFLGFLPESVSGGFRMFSRISLQEPSLHQNTPPARPSSSPGRYFIRKCGAVRPHAHGSATASRVDQAATIKQRSTETKNWRHWRRRSQVLGDTGDAAHSTFLSHTSSSKEVCLDINVLFLKSVDTLFMGIKPIDRSMDQPSLGDTSSPSAGRERQESVALHIWSKEDVIGPCRKRRHLTPTRQSPPRASP